MVKLQEQNTNEVISEEIEKKIECKRRTSSVVEKRFLNKELQAGLLPGFIRTSSFLVTTSKERRACFLVDALLSSPSY